MITPSLLCRILRIGAFIAMSFAASISAGLAKSKSAESLVDQSELLIRERKFDQAERRLRNAIKLNPDIAEAHHNLGLVYARLGNNDDAYHQFESAVRLNPQLSQSWLMLASVQQANGNLKSAISSYDQFLAKFPKDKLFDRIKKLRNGLQVEQDKFSNQSILPDQSPWLHSQMPLSVSIGTLPKEIERIDGASKVLEVVLRKAFKQWQSASRGVVRFTFVKELKNADIECRFVLETREFVNSAEAGQCEFYLNDRNERLCLIKFQISPITDGALRLDVDGSRFERAALHEIGHALGLVGHTRNPKDIMFYSTQVAGTMKLSDADIERLRRLYINNQNP